MLSAVAPGLTLKRVHAREALARYEGAKPSRLRETHRTNQSGDAHTSLDADNLRATARYLERNHDLARGALSVLVRNIVGPNGIGVEPMPRRADGSVDTELARALTDLWRDFTRRPEVTWTRGWASACRLACRSWLRDGEMFAQTLAGSIPTLNHGTAVPFSVELLEADLVPFDYDRPARGIRQGVERNAWGRHIAYHVYKGHPGDLLPTVSTLFPELKRVPAERMLHPFMSDRISQTRGVSLFASVITRLQDIKDYEESERVAAKVAASMAAYIRKGTSDLYPDDGRAEKERRQLKFQAGMIFDDLGPGEDIGTIDTKRPNENAGEWRNDQLRAFASGADVGHSSVSRRYDGNFSAQRQELVEQWASYRVLADDFIGQFVQPAWERFVSTAAAAGLIPVRRDVQLSQLVDAEFRPPPMPWIDPTKEATAFKTEKETGGKSVPQHIRERGGDWRDVVRSQVEYEEFLHAERRRRGLTTDGASNAADQSA